MREVWKGNSAHTSVGKPVAQLDIKLHQGTKTHHLYYVKQSRRQPTPSSSKTSEATIQLSDTQQPGSISRYSRWRSDWSIYDPEQHRHPVLTSNPTSKIRGELSSWLHHLVSTSSLVENGPLVPVQLGYQSRLANWDLASGTKAGPGSAMNRDQRLSTWPLRSVWGETH